VRGAVLAPQVSTASHSKWEAHRTDEYRPLPYVAYVRCIHPGRTESGRLQGTEGDDVAIATIERDPARDTGTPDLRFRLLQQVCGSPSAGYWRAIDRRSGKPCVVRVIDADPEQSSRRLGELHRERTLAERIGHPGVLRADVPLIEADRIFQVVDPEPARAVEPDAEGGRLAVLNLLVAVASVLAEAHSRGVFHGAFSRASCLRSGDGRVLVQGFTGDAASAAAVRDGAAADHRAFLDFANEMLRQTGGPPPRLRRYFTQHLADPAPKPAATAMADLCTDLRESLEDTFPWPLAAQAVDTAITAESPTLTLVQRDLEIAPDPVADLPTRPDALRPAVSKQADADRPRIPDANVAAPAGDLRVVPSVVRETQPVLTSAASPDPANGRPPDDVAPIEAGGARRRRAKARAAAAARQPEAPKADRVLADVPVLQQLTASPAPAAARASTPRAREDAPRGRSGRPWLTGLATLLVIAAAMFLSSRSRAPETPGAAPVPASGEMPVSQAPQPGAVSAPAAANRDRPSDTATPPPKAAVQVTADRVPNAPRDRAASAAPAPKPALAPTRVPLAAVGPSPVPAIDAAAQASAQAVRSRVSTLVAGGNRALNALEPGAAAEAFAAALALSPDDRAARDGSQRARRLQGVEALMRDAREAASRGDHGRAVQGYSQALANDPRNRGLADALATARRNLGRDATSSLLAEGHAALGAGRFEQARAAFEKALSADPLAPGARRAAEQAATAILLRDEAEVRRGTTTVAGRD